MGIPCEEIVVPNPLMSADGPVYSGPTNIYLAYPMQGPDGRGYITQPFTPPGSYMSQGSASYSPSMSYDGTNCYSSTPHTLNSGRDSGWSTQPASPPPPGNLHPPHATNDIPYSHLSHTEGYYDPLPSHSATENSSNLITSKSVTTNPAAPQEPRQTVPYIPGLSLESANNAHKKSPKRRKKKTKQEPSNEDSDNLKSSSPDEIDNLKANYIQHERTGECFMEAPVEPIHEIHLTDALADFLVNPPTDQEVSNEEETNISFISRSQSPPHIKETKEKSNESEISSETKAEVANEIIEVEIEDEEICEITQNIEDIKSSEIKFNSGEKIVEEDKRECIENIIEAVDVVNVSMNSGEEHNIDAENIVKTECVLSELECETGKSEQSKAIKNKEQGTKPLNKQTKISKKGQKLTVKSTKALQESNDPRLPQNTDSPAESKMSYSSVIKSNLIKEPKPIPPTTSQPKAESVPIPSPLPTSSSSQATTHQDYDKWEKVPSSVSKPQTWEKTSMKRKNKKKNIKFEDSSLTEDIPDLEVVSRIEEQTREVLIKESKAPQES